MIEYFILVVIFAYIGSVAIHIKKPEATDREKAIGSLIFGLLSPLWIVMYPFTFCYTMITGRKFFND